LKGELLDSVIRSSGIVN